MANSNNLKINKKKKPTLVAQHAGDNNYTVYIKGKEYLIRVLPDKKKKKA